MTNKSRLEKEKIIEVAADLFGEKGYAATSIRDISQALKVSIATLYYYFKNKEDLLFTIIESIGDDLLVRLKEARDKYEDPMEALREMLSRHIALTEKKKNMVKVYVVEQHNLSKRFKKIIYKQHREIYDVYIEQLRRLRDQGLISSEPLSVTAFAIFGMVNWCYRWFKQGGRLSINDVTQRLIDMIFYGIIDQKTPTSGKEP
ncbi:MAG: TetR family transcriptional regulator [Deltaproteobacteria bacterium]|nr:TetR family transcriptional regulator [Deltaproteobacteria bacterium]MBW2139285.1 TetR family transcriptional regulator [Deltaproteobacteria bacterium]